MIAYLITNIINDKSYVGITKLSLHRRYQTHLQNVNKGKSGALYNAIRKYGIDSFVIQELACALSLKALSELEKILIIQYNTKCPFGYNMTDGGDGTSGWIPSKEQRQSASIKGKERHKNMTESEKKKWSESISISKMGKPNLKLRGQQPNLGKIRSLEFKTKISNSMKIITSAIPEEMSRRAKCADPKKISVSSKATWAKDGYKEKMSVIISNAAKEKWKDPIQKERVRMEMQEVWRKRKLGLLPMPKRRNK